MDRRMERYRQIVQDAAKNYLGQPVESPEVQLEQARQVAYGVIDEMDIPDSVRVWLRGVTSRATA